MTGIPKLSKVGGYHAEIGRFGWLWSVELFQEALSIGPWVRLTRRGAQRCARRQLRRQPRRDDRDAYREIIR